MFPIAVESEIGDVKFLGFDLVEDAEDWDRRFHIFSNLSAHPRRERSLNSKKDVARRWMSWLLQGIDWHVGPPNAILWF